MLRNLPFVEDVVAAVDQIVHRVDDRRRAELKCTAPAKKLLPVPIWPVKSMEASVSVGKVDILKTRGKVQSEIARSTNPDKELFRAISILSAVINVQHAQELIETQGIQTFNKY